MRPKRTTQAVGADNKPVVKKGGGKVKSKILTIFTRQLATLIEAGLPLMRSLNTLAKQERNPVMRTTMAQLASAVESGGTFSEALAQHPRIFDKLYVNMVKAGELGGVLEIVLTRLAEFQEKSQKIKGKVVSAMVYPLVVLVIAGGDSDLPAHLHRAEVPADLPGRAAGQAAARRSRCSSSAAAICSSRSGISSSARSRHASSAIRPCPAPRREHDFLDRIALKIPVFGDLTSKTAISRFARTLGTLISSGVPILQALNITRDTAGNTVVANAINKIHDSVKEGESVVGPMESSSVFPADGHQHGAGRRGNRSVAGHAGQGGRRL